MSKDFAWQLFKNTGNLDAFMIMREYEEIGEELTPNRDLDVTPPSKLYAFS